MLTRLLVNHLLVNIAYMKIWVHLTFVLVHLRKKVTPTRATSAKSYSRALVVSVQSVNKYHILDIKLFKSIPVAWQLLSVLSMWAICMCNIGYTLKILYI